MKPLRWPVFVAVLALGVGFLAASLRHRSASRRSSRAPSASIDETPTDSGMRATSPLPSGDSSVLSIESIRVALQRPGVDPEGRRALLREAARRHPTGVLRLLTERLRDTNEDATVRTMALVLIPEVARLEQAEAQTLEALKEVLSDSTFKARYLVIKAIGDLRTPLATSTLLATLQSDLDASSRVEAARSLGATTPSDEAVAALQAATLSDPSDTVRLAALGTLIASVGPSCRDFLRTVADLEGAPASVRVLASRGLETLSKR